MTSEITFFVFAAMAIAGAVLTISRTKASHSAMAFGLTLLGCAGIFVLLHAPLLLLGELLLAACTLVGLLVFAVEVAKLDVATAPEYRWRGKVAGWCAGITVLLEVVALFVQRRWFPGQSVLALMPASPLADPPAANAVMKFLFSVDLLPVAMSLTILLIAAVGCGALFQRRA